MTKTENELVHYNISSNISISIDSVISGCQYKMTNTLFKHGKNTNDKIEIF